MVAILDFNCFDKRFNVNFSLLMSLTARRRKSGSLKVTVSVIVTDTYKSKSVDIHVS